MGCASGRGGRVHSDVGVGIAPEAKGAGGSPEGEDAGGDAKGGGGVLDGVGETLLRIGSPGRVAKGNGLDRNVDGCVPDGMCEESLVVGDGVDVNVGLDFVSGGDEAALWDGARRSARARRGGSQPSEEAGHRKGPSRRGRRRRNR